MAVNSTIEWTTSTWNPATGCSKISLGCVNCYAETLALRLQAMGNPRYRNGFKLTLHEDILELPLAWPGSQMIFVNSMSDLFHEDIPDSFIRRVFETIERAHEHTFQVLTKRAERLAELAPNLDWPDNLWMGVTVESQDYVGRIDLLASTPARVKFVSAEPLLGPLDFDVSEVDWVIVGGESGRRARPMRKEWVLSIRDRCERAGVPFFFKQWGGVNKKQAGRKLEGRIHDEFPEVIAENEIARVA